MGIGYFSYGNNPEAFHSLPDEFKAEILSGRLVDEKFLGEIKSSRQVDKIKMPKSVLC